MRLTPSLLCSAYRAGIFPMAHARLDREIVWMDPDERCILPLEKFRLSRRDRRSQRSAGFVLRLDEDFRGVVKACAAREETWISHEIEAGYVALHEMGLAHSVEVYAGEGGDLVGGLYGVALGGAFFGESMFSRVSHASKAAMQFLVERLQERGYILLDVQFWTAHLARLGAIDISREDYHRLLAEALQKQASLLSR